MPHKGCIVGSPPSIVTTFIGAIFSRLLLVAPQLVQLSRKAILASCLAQHHQPMQPCWHPTRANSSDDAVPSNCEFNVSKKLSRNLSSIRAPTSNDWPVDMSDSWAGDSARTTPQGLKSSGAIIIDGEHDAYSLPAALGTIRVLRDVAEGFGADVACRSLIKSASGRVLGGADYPVAFSRMHRTATVTPISPDARPVGSEPNEPISPDANTTPWAPAARRRNTQLLDLLGLTHNQPLRSSSSYSVPPAIYDRGDVAPQRVDCTHPTPPLEVLDVLDVRALCADKAVVAHVAGPASHEVASAAAGMAATCAFEPSPSLASFGAADFGKSTLYNPLSYILPEQPHSPLLSPRRNYEGTRQRAIAIGEPVIEIVHLSAIQQEVFAHAHCGELPYSIQRCMAGTGGSHSIASGGVIDNSIIRAKSSRDSYAAP